MISDCLDAWLPAATLRTQHRRAATAPPELLWRATRAVAVAETRTLGRLVRWRLPGSAAVSTFGELLRSYPFSVLEEGDRFSISGLCGRIWTLASDYPRLAGPDDFRSWSEPGTVRVLIAHWVAALPDGRAEVVSEARVRAVDRAAALRLRALWLLVGPFDQLIGAEGLSAAVRRAEEH